jgi:sialidase-1
MDDRDTGIVALGDERLLLSWFSTDTRRASVYDHYRNVQDQEHVRRYASGFARMTDSSADRWVGSWVRTSSDVGQTWSPPVRVPITAPHGPILLRSGELLYLGKAFLPHGGGPILAFSSRDAGRSWCELGRVPLYPGTVETQYHEPHAVELPDGRFIGLIRLQNAEGAPRLEDIGLTDFSLVQTVSQDAGRTWSPAHPLGFHGSPPHLLRHSSGAVVCVYGYRRPPFGQRAMLSHDGATSWQYDYVLRDDGPDADLGYPSTVELGDGTLLTVYYQKRASAEEKCSILWTRWRLPA